MPFAIQRVQTDRGGEFFAEKVQQWLMDHAIKFRPIPPRSPHLNGKVERSQQTDLQEFWARVKPNHPQITTRIEEWQFDYNWRRGHGSLKGMTPAEWSSQFGDKVPLWDEVAANYEAHKERFQMRDFRADRQLAALLGEQKSQTKKRNDVCVTHI